LIGLGGRLFTTEPNHGEIDEIGLDGTVRRVAMSLKCGCGIIPGKPPSIIA